MANPKSLIGYILAIVGILGFLLTYEFAQTLINITLPNEITSTVLTIISLALILLGGFLVWKFSNKKGQLKEVPIYSGKRVVGYRMVK